MADMAQLESQIRALEARRAAGESVPQLDALYAKMDAMTEKGYKAATTPTVKKAKGGSIDEKDISKTKKMAMGGRSDPRYPVPTSVANRVVNQPRKPLDVGTMPRPTTTSPANRVVNQPRTPLDVRTPLPRPTARMKNGGSVGSASKRADGCVMRGKTKGKMI